MAKLLKIADAAALCGVSADTLRRWERAGVLTAVRTAGGQRRYREEDVKAIADSDHVASGTPGRGQRESLSPTLQVNSEEITRLWHEARRYILAVTTKPIPWREDDRLYQFYQQFGDVDPIYFRWDSRTSDECTRRCEVRVKMRLMPGITLRDLKAVIWQTVYEYTACEIDRRTREEEAEEDI